MYKKVSTDMNFVDREKETEKFWEDNHIFEKSMEDREGCPQYMFYDGPPTANGKPHIGHVLTRVIKDMIPRYRTMKGYEVPRKAGWDTHGLPVELEVEKALGLDGKDQIEKYGVEPFITMYHWELPYELYKKGGWLNRDIAEWFGEYAKLIAERFSDRVKYFFTLNEPQCFVGLGYLRGEHAPGVKAPLRDTFEMAHNALRAHGRAVQMLRAYAKQPIQVGFAPTCGMCYPETEKPEDIEAARQMMFSMSLQPSDNWTWNVAWWSDPVLLGHYPEEGIRLYEPYLPKITDADMKLISGPLDIYGQNIYNGRCFRMGADGKPQEVTRPLGAPKTAVGWPVTPECIYWGLKYLDERYHMPMYLTENGMACHDCISLDGKVHDPNRIDFLARYLKQVKRAASEIDLRGYFEWTLLDNFEWNKGYAERFGLVYVDFETQKRIWKDSAYWYADVVKENGANI